MKTSISPPTFNDFDTCGRAVLTFLRQRLGFGLWMITRTEGDEWIVLQVEDNGYGVTSGNVFQWADSFCYQMVQGNGPRIAPDSDLVDSYVTAPIGRQVPIKAYIGVPLTNPDGTLFGTLCAIAPAVQPHAITQEIELIELLAGLLSTILVSELEANKEARRSERLEMEAQTDALTQISNRRAWDHFLAKEEDRCRRYGHPSAVLVIDLDDLKQVNDEQGHAEGDALIVRAAQALRKAAREVDVVARLGGDEFGMIAVECDIAGAHALLARTRQALADNAVEASVGMAVRIPSSGLKSAWESADQQMYEAKRARKLA